MTAVSDFSPLITLSKIGRPDVLLQLYRHIAITPQVYDEVVVKGSGFAGSAEIATAAWIEVKTVRNPVSLMVAQRQMGLGLGELHAITLAKETDAGLVPIDEIKARALAKARN